jgi:high affinity Mn2+ porin
LRGGAFQLTSVPHGPQIEPVLLRQYMGVVEAEARYELWNQPGKINFLLYGDNGYLSKVDQVVALAYSTDSLPPSIDNLRTRRVKVGGGVNIQQQLVPGLGLFVRASLADSRYQYVDFTNIDRSLSTGVVASGQLWGRSKDEIGAGVAFSGLSGSHARYYASGGVEAFIGDGALSYNGEKAVEMYYKLGLSDAFDLTFDYQLIGNPGYNSARGPINVFGVRMRAGF